MPASLARVRPRIGAIPVKAIASLKDPEACTVGVGAALAANTGVAGAMHRVGFFAAEAAPTGYADCLRIQFSKRQRSPKGWAISHGDCARPRIGAIPVKAIASLKDPEACTVGVGAALAANTGVAGAMHRVGFFAAEAAPTGYADCLRIQFSKRQRSPKGWAISHGDRARPRIDAIPRVAEGLRHACASASTNCALVMVERPLMSLRRASFIRLCLLWVSRELPDLRE